MDTRELLDFALNPLSNISWSVVGLQGGLGRLFEYLPELSIRGVLILESGTESEDAIRDHCTASRH